MILAVHKLQGLLKLRMAHINASVIASRWHFSVKGNLNLY